ncbi:hypothetical protein [Dapis sp. BLCC M229]
MSNQNPPLLTITNLHTYYGDSHILQGINIEVKIPRKRRAERES